jgi:hypothetical protein
MDKKRFVMTNEPAAVLGDRKRCTPKTMICCSMVSRCGKQSRLANMPVEDYIRPVAIAGAVLEMRQGGVYYDGEPVVRFGFRSLGHSLARWLAENGTSADVIQAMCCDTVGGYDDALCSHHGAQGIRSSTSLNGNCREFRDLISGPRKSV